MTLLPGAATSASPPAATPQLSQPPNHLWLTKRFKSRDTPSPKGLSKFIQLNYVSLLGTGNARRGSKTLLRTTTESVKSNTANSPAPVKDWKCHQERG